MKALPSSVVVGLILVVLSTSSSHSQKRFEINTALMESTFRIAGPGTSGTAFVLGIPSKKDSTKGFYVLVTAHHVLDSAKTDDVTLYLRTKTADGRFSKLANTLKIKDSGRPLWTRHPDSTVDIAVMYLPVPRVAYMPDILPTTFLANDSLLQEFEIHPGDELLCLGYPLGAESSPAGFAILRSGRIASYPLLPSKEVKLFKYDFSVFKGNSGGPVYFFEANRNYKGGTHVGTIQFIAGLVVEENFFRQKAEFLYETQEIRYPLRLANVVNASLIAETIKLLPPRD